jgi:hypothetical protein
MLPVSALQEGSLPWQDWLTPGQDGLYHSPADRGWGALTASAGVTRTGTIFWRANMRAFNDMRGTHGFPTAG